MEIAVAQRDLSSAYIGGAPAVFVSGVVWLIAGLVELKYGAEIAFGALFIGGMLILPVALLIGHFLFGAPRGPAGNPLQRLGFESTVVLFAGIFIGYALLRVAPALAFPALAVVIGARYFSFRTIYDEPVYWVLGGVLAAIGTLAIASSTWLPIGFLLLVGLVECAFAALLLVRWKRR